MCLWQGRVHPRNTRFISQIGATGRITEIHVHRAPPCVLLEPLQLYKNLWAEEAPGKSSRWFKSVGWTRSRGLERRAESPRCGSSLCTDKPCAFVLLYSLLRFRLTTKPHSRLAWVSTQGLLPPSLLWSPLFSLLYPLTAVCPSLCVPNVYSVPLSTRCNPGQRCWLGELTVPTPPTWLHVLTYPPFSRMSSLPLLTLEILVFATVPCSLIPMYHHCLQFPCRPTTPQQIFLQVPLCGS